MKRLVLIVLLLSSPVFTACHPPTTIVTPAGKSAYAADQVVIRLQEISNVVSADIGTGPGQIHAADAFTILEWISGDAHGNPPTTGLVQIVQTAGSGQGWKAAAKQGWQTRIRVIFMRYPKLAPYVDIVDSLVEVV